MASSTRTSPAHSSATHTNIVDADARIQYGLSQAALRYNIRRTAYGHTTSSEQALNALHHNPSHLYHFISMQTLLPQRHSIYPS